MSDPVPDPWSTLEVPDSAVRKERRLEQRKQRKLDELYTRNKRFPQQLYNQTLTPAQLETWCASLDQTKFPDLGSIHRWVRIYHTLSTRDIGYHFKQPPETIQGLECVFVFVDVAEHCAAYTQRALRDIGWNRDCTNYEPVVVSNSVEELIETTIEHHRMLIKQALRCVCDTKQWDFPLVESCDVLGSESPTTSTTAKHSKRAKSPTSPRPKKRKKDPSI
jgi:hypothetical protein